MATLSLPGCDLYYEVEGDGVPVVLIHGLSLDTRMWDDQIPALRGIAQVIRYDARGFGRSTRSPDVAYTHAGDMWALLDHLGVDSAVVVGLSMGGRIAIQATGVHPQRVRALVLLDAVVDGVPWDPEAAAGMQAIGTAYRAGGLAAAKAAWLDHDFFAPARRNPRVAARLEEMVADYPGLAWTEKDPHGPHEPVLEVLPTLALPTTVVVGELDVPGFRDMAEVVAATVPGARKVVVPDVGHMVNMEAPEAVNEVLRGVIESV
ncbi:MAG TPA: alpha/beta fold hydrolase [Mycobacteriales bacterium]|nr:alpha/beta fold hydrolase [Mycobacteriales bacterium]